MIKTKIIILGTGGSSVDILDTINDFNEHHGRTAYECVGFLDDNQNIWGKKHYGFRVLGPLESALNYDDCFFINGIGSPFNFWKKKDIISKIRVPLDKFANIIHPTASVSKTSKIGFGSIIFQNVTIMSNVDIGKHVIILPNSVISHDDIIGDYTCIAGGVCISGSVKVGNSCYMGTNSTVIGNITIGDYCLIGMGSVVINDVGRNSVVVGNPAQFLRKTIEC